LISRANQVWLQFNGFIPKPLAFTSGERDLARSI